METLKNLCDIELVKHLGKLCSIQHDQTNNETLQKEIAATHTEIEHRQLDINEVAKRELTQLGFNNVPQ